ncbi:MAG: 16S rRNA (cytosine(967)-C(5))-methyltransferase RsmB [Massilioclostridium sp.]|nr:16S rRNA (cytosine(967)-C(5))-methyltransferase RsmB [Massilioclostridium sp.]
MTNRTARDLALSALLKMDKQGAYSNLAFDGMLSSSSLSPRDRDFAAKLFYGVLETKITLDYIIASYATMKPEKISSDVRNILRLGLYQIKYLDLEDFAAVNESVNLVKLRGKKSASGFVNAILRAFLRDGKNIPLPEDPDERLSVRFSCPVWLVRSFVGEYGRETAERILESQLGRPPLTLRVNTLKTSAETLCALLQQEGIEAVPHPQEQTCVEVLGGGALTGTKAFAEGLFHVQDISSQLCARTVASYAPRTLLDVCAAPGGKTFTIAEELGDAAEITACDLHKKRVGLIKQGAARLGLCSVDAVESDASKANDRFGQFDAVLCDVPCSGFGVIRRKPEIKYKPQESLQGLPAIQGNILQTSASYVKEGGMLIYSTCTIAKRENEQVVDEFLRRNPAFVPAKLPGFLHQWVPDAVNRVTFLPGVHNSDGFFLAVFQKMR